MLRSVARILLVTLCILAVPLAAMQFTSEVNWTAFDFCVAFGLLFAAGSIWEFGVRRLRRHRMVLGAALAAAFLLVWAQLAVGIFS